MLLNQGKERDWFKSSAIVHRAQRTATDVFLVCAN
jgi:hypothetical protein